MNLAPLGGWLRDSLLPAVLFVLLAILIARFLRWVGNRYRQTLDREVLAAIEKGGGTSERTKRARAVAQAVEWSAVSLTYFVIGLVVLKQLGIPLTSLVAPATVAGVAIGFGAQQVVGDLLAGFFLFTERQFGIGDLVRLSTPGQLTGILGTVEELTLRVTKLRSQTGEVIVVPNSSLRQVTNLSKDWSRVVLDIPIPVEEDLDVVTKLVDEVSTSMAAEESWRNLIIGDPTVAGVETIQVGYVQLRLFVRTQPGRQFDVGRELRLRVATALRNAEIKSPQVQLAQMTNP
ncbi:MAG: mechanosensitive ion channel family protein [Actinomycetota bacterium]|nr:mechanosensitive ion channel family protein [Actinomycetota bacterium]